MYAETETTLARLRLICLPAVLILFALAACAEIPAGKPIVILVSIDGLGSSMLQSADTPTLDQLAADGLSVDKMRPVYPTLTFPNHYSIATGLYPKDHGIVGNTFPDLERDDWYTLYDRTKVQDGKWYGGEPVWVLAEKNDLTAMSYFFVGTEAPVSGIKPTVAFDFDASVPGTERIDTALGWLTLPTTERPRFITLYFEDVDVASHKHGPGSPEVTAAIRRVDGYLRRLIDGIDASPIADLVHYVVVSDHGQGATLADQDVFILDSHVDFADARIVEGGAYLNLFDATLNKNDADAICAKVNAVWQHGRCYTPRSAPSNWRVSDDPRYPDVFMVANEGHALLSTAEERKRLTKGDHGWPPEAASMQAIFLASGAMIESGVRLESIRSVDVYPLLLALLGLEPSREIPNEQKVLLDYVDSF